MRLAFVVALVHRARGIVQEHTTYLPRAVVAAGNLFEHGK